MSSAATTGVSFCFVTAPSKEVANKLADAIVEGKLAACVNVIPGRDPLFPKAVFSQDELQGGGISLPARNILFAHCRV